MDSTSQHGENIDTITLRQHVLINQVAAATGSEHDIAKHLLQATDWRLEAALSLFFQDRTVPIPCKLFCPDLTSQPANTPATPPNFPETLLAFSKLSASSSDNNYSQQQQIQRSNGVPLSSSPINTMMIINDGNTSQFSTINSSTTTR
ncbi:unnamed protein product [Didymodactylos carnosus]|uniref:UBA-like domain-containing protein n=1 Tax=Didymodactylos carnosus TaxID=1234261 RepID=A0A814EVT8_9BILA|nr:unnamed protein product [Didymodactylos carnosus]CAF0974587.1 unnamed protein product [Didymodactylos carnosus]CAF3563110.1 unnamed protein product [Didymodactylos carnosus]CAF3747455.1 unnamed protein product [Didymodactylos carnosus]